MKDKHEGWLAASPSKRWCEGFFLIYSCVWVSWVAVIVGCRMYEGFSKWDYVIVGLVAAVPCFVLPMVFQSKADREKPLSQRYWFKANVWIAVFSFVGNYFWTHYFYRVLGAAYTMQTYDLNQVPICMYLMTHAYFCLYHVLSNILIRKVRAGLLSWGRWSQNLGEGIAVFCFAYFAAFMETYTIEEFPYYSFIDRRPMYTIGSLFYAIYFFVSFPVFYRMDEDPTVKWSLLDAISSSLAASMLVTILLDLWRLILGPMVDMGPGGHAHGPPWLMATRNSRYI